MGREMKGETKMRETREEGFPTWEAACETAA
jgi:hypothetical protein